MDPTTQEILDLYRQGVKLKTIAKRVGMGESAVSMRINRHYTAEPIPGMAPSPTRRRTNEMRRKVCRLKSLGWPTWEIALRLGIPRSTVWEYAKARRDISKPTTQGHSPQWM